MHRPKIPCKTCGKEYNYRKNMLRHVRYECGKEPSNFCPHCSFRCKQPYNLTQHLRMKHAT